MKAWLSTRVVSVASTNLDGISIRAEMSYIYFALLLLENWSFIFFGSIVSLNILEKNDKKNSTSSCHDSWPKLESKNEYLDKPLTHIGTRWLLVS